MEMAHFGQISASKTQNMPPDGSDRADISLESSPVAGIIICFFSQRNAKYPRLY